MVESKMRLAVVGSRDFSDLRLVDSYLDQHRDDIKCIVSGGARGVDQRAETWAMQHYIQVVSFRPIRSKLQKGQPWFVVRFVLGVTDSKDVLPTPYPSFATSALVRNGFIVEFATDVVAFWDGHSTGTQDSIRKARELGNLKDIING